MTCTCGTTNPEGARFCRNCGSALSSAARPLEPRAAAPASPIDAQPYLPRTSTNVLSKMEGVRDRIYEWFVAASEDLGVDAMVLKSHPFTATVSVSYECWMPHEREAGLAERGSAVVTVRPRELHRFEHEIDVTIAKGRRSKTYRSVIEFTPATAREVVQYLVDRSATHPTFFFKRCRVVPWQLWLPSNPLTGLERDFGWVPWTALAVVLFAVLVGIQAESASAAFLALLFSVPFLGIGQRIYTEIVARRRHMYVISAGRPLQEPRNLLRMDSWQTLVNDLGPEATATREALRAALASTQQEGASLSDERIWYRGVDGKQEREQLVVMFRRAIAFVQVYPYGKDLYVGWDAHVNCGTWVEKLVDLGRDPHSRELCQVNGIQAGWYTPNEYDVADANCLIEWVHAATTRVIKRTLAEHRIDQEIDFQILRGQRQGIAGRSEGAPAKPRLLSRFTRES